MYDSFLAVVVCLFCCSFLLEIVVNDVLIGRKFSYKKIHEYINITLGAYHLCSINYERKAGTQLLITKSFNPTKNNLSQAMNEILLNREIKRNKKNVWGFKTRYIDTTSQINWMERNVMKVHGNIICQIIAFMSIVKRFFFCRKITLYNKNNPVCITRYKEQKPK